MKINPDFETLLADAHHAAKAAAAHMPDVGACGFAWVTVDGREPFARYCRTRARALELNGHSPHRFGGKGYPTGWRWWCPGYNGQSIDAHEKAAAAFRDELAKHNIRATCGSRLD
jgi:hypothetical protein